MNILFCVIGMIFASAISLRALDAEKLVNLHEIGVVLGFPENELRVTNILKRQQEISKQKLLGAIQIDGKQEFTFFPIMVLVTAEGALVTQSFRKFLLDWDLRPHGPISEGGRGPLGSLKLGAGLVGGLYLGQIETPATEPPLSIPIERFAVSTKISDLKGGLDVRVAILASFSDEKELMKVPGGELYYKKFSESAEIQGDRETSKSDGADLKAIFTSLNQIVIASPMFSELKEGNRTARIPDVDQPGVSEARKELSHDRITADRAGTKQGQAAGRAIRIGLAMTGAGVIVLLLVLWQRSRMRMK